MQRKQDDNREQRAREWSRLLRRMVRVEVRASTLALLLLIVWLLLLVQVWKDPTRLFGG